jgi:hypothetical protein
MRFSHATTDYPDLLAGALMIGLGGLGFWAAHDLEFGSAARMGAGYLPGTVCGLLVAIGAVVLAKALSKTRLTTGDWNIKPLLVLTIAVVGFAVLAETCGFVISSVWLLATASFADRDSRWKEVIVSTLLLTVSGALVFVWALGVKMPLSPF